MTQTRPVTVGHVDADGITTTDGGWTSWAESLAATMQKDAELAAAYRGVLRSAGRFLERVSVTCIPASSSETGRTYYIADATWCGKPIGLGGAAAFLPSHKAAESLLQECGLGDVPFGGSNVTLSRRCIGEAGMARRQRGQEYHP